MTVSMPKACIGCLDKARVRKGKLWLVWLRDPVKCPELVTNQMAQKGSSGQISLFRYVWGLDTSALCKRLSHNIEEGWIEWELFHISKIRPYAVRAATFFSPSNRLITLAVKQKAWDFLQRVCPPGGRPTGKCGAHRCFRFFRDGAEVLFKHGNTEALKCVTQLVKIILRVPEKF